MKKETLVGAALCSMVLTGSLAQSAGQGRDPALSPSGTDFFVSPQGNDRWSGKRAEPRGKEGPFATIERAQESVRALLRSRRPRRPVRVVLRGGTYYLRRTLEFGPEDSGREGAPVIYAAAPGEQVILSGGRPLDPAAFEPVRDPAILARLPEEARSQVMQVDLRAQGVTDFGVMRPHGWGRSYVNPPLELFFNDQPLPLARWPNRGMLPLGEVIDPGSAPRSGDYNNRGGTFTFDDDRPARWTQADDLWLSGYFAYGYADDTMKVKSIDLEKRTITLEQAHRYGLKSGLSYHAYYALNLLEEIDEPGEWYLDRKSGRLYLWPPSDLRTARIAVSLLEEPMVALEGASYVTLRGLTFEVSRGMGVYIERGTGNLIAGCTFRNLGSVAVCLGQGIKMDSDGLTGYRLQNGADRGERVPFEPASRTLGDFGKALYADTTWNRQAGTHHGIVACDIYDTNGGIILSGGDRKTLTPGGNYVLNCHIHHYSRVDRTRTAVSIDGVGNRVAHCLIHDAPLGAIMLCGNDHVVEFNEIHHVCLEADDMAAYYFGRDPSERGNVFRYNFVHHTGPPEVGLYGASALFFDDGACGGIVEGNVFYRVRACAIRINGGHDHVFRNNIFVDTVAAIPSGMNNEQWQNFLGDPLQVVRLRQAVDILQPPYVTRYPELADTFETDPNYPRRNLVQDNLSVRSGDFGTGSNEVQGNWVTDEDPGFVDGAAMNFQLKPDSTVFTKIPGFRPIPFERIGLYVDEYRPILPPRELRGWEQEQG